MAGTGVHVNEQRGVTLHEDEIGVALHGGHKDSVAKGGFHRGGGWLLSGSRIPRLDSPVFMGGPFADENLRTGPVIFSGVVQRHLEKLIGRTVVMLVNHVGLAAMDPQVFGLVVGDAGNGFKLWIPRLDGVVELRKASVVAVGLVEPVFVADLDVSEFERRRVAVLRAPGAPRSVHIAGHIFDFLQRLLNERIEVRARVDVSAFKGIAAINCQYGLSFHVFAPLQKFQKPHSVSRAIAPRAGVAVALFNRTQRLFPFESSLDCIALQVIAAGKTQELRVQVHQHLHQILAQAVRAVVPSRREKRHKAEPDRSRPVECNHKTGPCGRSDFAGLERQLEFLPFGREPGELFPRVNAASVFAQNGKRDRAGKAGIGLGQE